jgi:hypothetical protein
MESPTRRALTFTKGCLVGIVWAFGAVTLLWFRHETAFVLLLALSTHHMYYSERQTDRAILLLVLYISIYAQSVLYWWCPGGAMLALAEAVYGVTPTGPVTPASMEAC